MVAETGRAKALGAKGEIPYLLTPGETYYYADLQDQTRRLNTRLQRNATAGFSGRASLLTDIGITTTRTPEREQRQVDAAHLGCPNCGGPLSCELR